MTATRTITPARAGATGQVARRAGWLVLGIAVAGFAPFEVSRHDFRLARV